MNNQFEKVVIGSPSYGHMAKLVAAAGGWGLVDVEWGRYPDGGTRHRCRPSDVIGKAVTIVGGTVNPFERQSILQLCTTLTQYGAAQVQVLNPYMGTQRGDRWTKEGEMPAAKLELAEFSKLANPNFSLVLFDLHNETVANYGDITLRVAPYRYNTLTAQVVRELAGREGRVASMDLGGRGRVKKIAEDCGLLPVFCDKERFSPTEVKVTVASSRQLIEGRRVIMVDDILETGRTADGAAVGYRESGALHVEAWFSHASTTEEAVAWLKGRGNISHIHVTNSYPGVEQLKERFPDFVSMHDVSPILKQASINPWDWIEE